MKTVLIGENGPKLAPHRHHNAILKPHYFEQIAWKKEMSVIGIDEVGRGCLAGPLVVSAAILPINTGNSYLRDSKTMSPKQREHAFDWITEHGIHTSVILSPWEIQHHNIYQATRRAMKRAFLQIIASPKTIKPLIDMVLIDAMQPDIPYIPLLPNLTIHSFNKGEQFSKSIAAASIIAKVTRDRLMQKISSLFRHYELEKHKGYATAQHRSAILSHQASIIHRHSFLRNITPVQPISIQTSLFKT